MTNLVEFPAGVALKWRVAEEVRVLMTRRRAKQSDLAAVLSVSQGQVSQRLNGHVEFTVSELEALARYFDVDPTDLLGHGSAPRPQGPGGGGRYAIRDSTPEPADMEHRWSDLPHVA